MKEFPDHLVYEIRVRLPTKSLVRFRCVARTWNNITQDPYLARKQLNHHNPTTTLLCLIMFEQTTSVGANFTSPGIQIRVPKDYYFSGACNGWICFGKQDPFISLSKETSASPLLYNPLTRQIRELPPLTPLTCPHLNNKASSYKYYGLGFDTKTHLFKLFAIAYILGRLEFFKFTQNNSNSWVLMELPTPAVVYGCVTRPKCSVFLNGVVHYHLELEYPTRQVIVAFDVHKEEVKLMAFPPAIPPNRHCVLSKLNGLLAIFEYPDKDCLNVHMQLSPGEWNVEHTITRNQVLFRFGVTCVVQLYLTTCDDQLIIGWDREAVAYDIKTRKMMLLHMPRRYYITTDKLNIQSLQLSLVPLNF